MLIIKPMPALIASGLDARRSLAHFNNDRGHPDGTLKAIAMQHDRRQDDRA